MIAESPSIAFRPQSLELELRPMWRMQTTFNSLENIGTTTIHNYGGMFNGSWYAEIKHTALGNSQLYRRYRI